MLVKYVLFHYLKMGWVGGINVYTHESEAYDHQVQPSFSGQKLFLTTPKLKSIVQVHTDDGVFIKIRFSYHPVSHQAGKV